MSDIFIKAVEKKIEAFNKEAHWARTPAIREKMLDEIKTWETIKALYCSSEENKQTIRRELSFIIE